MKRKVVNKLVRARWSIMLDLSLAGYSNGEISEIFYYQMTSSGVRKAVETLQAEYGKKLEGGEKHAN